MNRSAAIILACIAVALPRPAFAYRPFDSTDAAVAAEGLAFDLGLRTARVDTNTALEVRAGLTWATSLWRSQ